MVILLNWILFDAHVAILFLVERKFLSAAKLTASSSFLPRFLEIKDSRSFFLFLLLNHTSLSSWKYSFEIRLGIFISDSEAHDEICSSLLFAMMLSSNLYVEVETMTDMPEMFESVPEDASSEKIEKTARDLENKSYEPMLLIDAPGFLRWTKKDLVAEYERLISMEEDDDAVMAIDDMYLDDIIEKQLGLLMYHYELLCELREGDADAWDQIHELLEDD